MASSHIALYTLPASSSMIAPRPPTHMFVLPDEIIDTNFARGTCAIKSGSPKRGFTTITLLEMFSSSFFPLIFFLSFSTWWHVFNHTFFLIYKFYSHPLINLLIARIEFLPGQRKKWIYACWKHLELFSVCSMWLS